MLHLHIIGIDVRLGVGGGTCSKTVHGLLKVYEHETNTFRVASVQKHCVAQLRFHSSAG